MFVTRLMPFEYRIMRETLLMIVLATTAMAMAVTYVSMSGFGIPEGIRLRSMFMVGAGTLSVGATIAVIQYRTMKPYRKK